MPAGWIINNAKGVGDKRLLFAMSPDLPQSSSTKRFRNANDWQLSPTHYAGDTEEPTPAERRAAMTWAQRLKRVFGIDIETCPVCGGAMRIIACIEDPDVITKILTHLDAKGAETGVPRRPPCRAPPQRELFD